MKLTRTQEREHEESDNLNPYLATLGCLPPFFCFSPFLLRMRKVILNNFLEVGVWNIHGLFSKVNQTKYCKFDEPEFQNALKYLDILCIQESHCKGSDTDNLHINGFKILNFSRQVSANNRCFGGLLLMHRESFSGRIKIVNRERPDKLWIKIDKQFFGLESDIFICFLYLSPHSSPYFKSLTYDMFTEVENECSYCKTLGKILIAGDLNARTNNEPDFVMDIDDRFSPINDIESYRMDDNLPRKNMDLHKVDSHGEKVLELYKSNYLRILNGICRGDNTGSFTRFPIREGELPSVLGYIIADRDLMDSIGRIYVAPLSSISDHCLVKTEICTQSPLVKHSKVAATKNTTINSINSRFKIDKVSLRKYQVALKSEVNMSKLKGIVESQFNENSTGVDQAVSEIQNIILETATQAMTPCKKKQINRNQKNKKP